MRLDLSRPLSICPGCLRQTRSKSRFTPFCDHYCKELHRLSVSRRERDLQRSFAHLIFDSAGIETEYLFSSRGKMKKSLLGEEEMKNLNLVKGYRDADPRRNVSF